NFLQYGGIAAIVLAMIASGASLSRRDRVAPEQARPTPPETKVVEAPPTPLPVGVPVFPRMRIARLGELNVNEPLDFTYPLNHPHHENFIVKLGVPALTGVGPERDIVAFNYACTHMGCPLKGFYNQQHKMLGPCPCHFTRFDLTKGGMVILGQATESLPQIDLELEDDIVYAVGVPRLIYGFRANLLDAKPLEVL
ncbi:MAG: arsenate reductase (azurin) small subunit, partial [Candidatus Bathyarchaeia archaeon]